VAKANLTLKLWLSLATLVGLLGGCPSWFAGDLSWRGLFPNAYGRYCNSPREVWWPLTVAAYAATTDAQNDKTTASDQPFNPETYTPEAKNAKTLPPTLRPLPFHSYTTNALPVKVSLPSASGYQDYLKQRQPEQNADQQAVEVQPNWFEQGWPLANPFPIEGQATQVQPLPTSTVNTSPLVPFNIQPLIIQPIPAEQSNAATTGSTGVYPVSAAVMNTHPDQRLLCDRAPINMWGLEGQKFFRSPLCAGPTSTGVASSWVAYTEMTFLPALRQTTATVYIAPVLPPPQGGHTPAPKPRTWWERHLWDRLEQRYGVLPPPPPDYPALNTNPSFYAQRCIPLLKLTFQPPYEFSTLQVEAWSPDGSQLWVVQKTGSLHIGWQVFKRWHIDLAEQTITQQHVEQHIQPSSDKALK
jgi:hypothetical protein